MDSRVLLFLAVVYSHSVYSSTNHGPSISPPDILSNEYLPLTQEVTSEYNTRDHEGHNSYSGSEVNHRDQSWYHGPGAIPQLLKNGHIADTAEVAAAKAEHLAAVAKAKTHGGYNSYSGSEDSHGAHGDYRYHGPTAIPQVLHNGYLADTHEVADAKAEHLAAVAKAKTHGGYNSYSGSENSHGDYRYHGPTAIPQVLHSGYIADTHEVADAKAEHLAAVAKAKTHGGYNSYSGSEDSHGARGYYRYHGPFAIPKVLHNGYIADTHEVTAAKAKHLAAVAKAKSRGDYNSYSGSSHGDYRYNQPIAIPKFLHNGLQAAAKSEHLEALSTAHGEYNDGSENSNGAHGDYRYHGPTAIPQVLHNGYIADTHEVAAAKAQHLAAVAKAKTHSHNLGGECNGHYDHHQTTYNEALPEPADLPTSSWHP